MKYLIIFYLLTACLYGLKAQPTDSVKYANGYLYYHTYGKGLPVLWLSGGPGNYCMDYVGPVINLLAGRGQFIIFGTTGYWPIHSKAI